MTDQKDRVQEALKRADTGFSVNMRDSEQVSRAMAWAHGDRISLAEEVLCLRTRCESLERNLGKCLVAMYEASKDFKHITDALKESPNADIQS